MNLLRHFKLTMHLEFSYLPFSQLFPVYPSSQTQIALVSSSKHIPLPLHGLSEQTVRETTRQNETI